MLLWLLWLLLISMLLWLLYEVSCNESPYVVDLIFRREKVRSWVVIWVAKIFIKDVRMIILLARPEKNIYFDIKLSRRNLM
jgi:hypothetical protein